MLTGLQRIPRKSVHKTPEPGNQRVSEGSVCPAMKRRENSRCDNFPARDFSLNVNTGTL
jgi:hypothetical protein